MVKGFATGSGIARPEPHLLVTKTARSHGSCCRQPSHLPTIHTMPIVKDLAQVLRVHEYANTSLILVLFCRRLGQVRVIAKGARRMPKKGFEGGFDLLVRGEILLYPRRNDGLWIFKEWEEHFRPRGTGDSIQALQLASYICELTEAFTVEGAGSVLFEEDQGGPEDGSDIEGAGEYPALYDALADAADRLEPNASPGALILSYTLRMLEWSGYLPDLSLCSSCGKKFAGKRARKAAVLSRRGLECEACVRKDSTDALAQRQDVPNAKAPTEAGIQLSPEALGALDFLKRTGKPVRFSKRAAANAARAMVALVHGALERDLRTLRRAASEVINMGS